MARTIQEIYDQMALEKSEIGQLRELVTRNDSPNSVLDDHQTLLNDLTSTSKVAIWRLFMWIISVAIWIHETLWDLFRKEVEDKIDNDRTHVAKWYQKQSLKFQYGDELVWKDNLFQYETYNEEKLIVKHAAVEERNGFVIIKVATEKNGEKRKLDYEPDTNHVQAFKHYWEKHKDAGVRINVISANPDLLKLKYKIHYDPMVMKPDGTLISNPDSRPVDDAINAYLDHLEFDGYFNLTKCEDYIQLE